MKNEKKDLLSVEESKPNETNDMLSVTDKSIAQNIPKLENKVINIPCKDKIPTTKVFDSDPEFFKKIGISKDNLKDWIIKKGYVIKGDNDKYMATEWSEKYRYVINQRYYTYIYDPVLMDEDTLGYIFIDLHYSNCGYFTQKGIEHIKNELEKERIQENEY